MEEDKERDAEGRGNLDWILGAGLNFRILALAVNYFVGNLCATKESNFEFL